MKLQNTFVFLCILFQGTLLILRTHTITASHLGNETDQLALLEFKSSMATNKVLNMWNESVPHCQWPGVTCGHKHHRVVALNLTGKDLCGPISPHLGNLSFLTLIDLTSNRIKGEIPHEIGRLSRLRLLNLSRNELGGGIPINLSYCIELDILRLDRNNLTGEIPTGLGSLEKLVSLILGENKLSGEIPHSLGNLSSLRELYAQDNHLQGNIPNELSKLTYLTAIAIALNNISGIFPPSLFNMSSIICISTAENPLSGSIPTDIGFTLPNLKQFGIGTNLFTGIIPESLANASQLTIISIGGNSFVGQVPHSLGSLPGLQRLNVDGNQLGGDPTEDLSFLESLSNCTNLNLLTFSGNNFTGNLPDSIANLSTQLEVLFMEDNKISGVFPEAMGNLFNLYVVSMGINLLSGIIPSSLGRLKKLQTLVLNENQFSGEIPSSLGDISTLSHLDLSFNKLDGNIPEFIGNYERLQILDLSNNNFSGNIPSHIMGVASLSNILDLSNNWLTGPLPEEIGKLISLDKLSLCNNNLSSEIPEVLGNCLSLEYLDFSRNSFRGMIPDTLTNLKGIKSLDFSQNNLSGKIPQGIENLTYLQYLNLSFNDLEGEVPTGGVFGDASAVSLVGNSKLCGGIPELELPPCPNVRAQKNHKLTIVVVIVVVFLIAVTLFGVLYWKRKKTKVLVGNIEEDKLMRISYWELHRATNGFSFEESIGSGSFGTVYRGQLNRQINKLVAVKVLNIQNSRASKSFVAECRILRNIRHRNLVKILTYCSSIDNRRNEFKALVYEYMSNGSLDNWLHPEETNTLMTLNFLQRLNVAIDIASALHYLHSNCEPPVIHCDLKPSNILLDSEMCARVGDFGLARFYLEASGAFSATSSIGVKGTIGYAAPEYGTCSGISVHGDVYSYGIILLEMITGRRPIDNIFRDGLNLHSFVKDALRNQESDILDPVLDRELQELQGENKDGRSYGELVVFEKNILAVLTIGVACSEEYPRNRMNMNDVTRELHRVKCAILGNGRNRF